MKPAIFYGGVWLAACSASSTLLAQAWRYPAAFGGWEVGGHRLYLPGHFLAWYGVTHPADWWAIHLAGAFCLAFGAACAWRAWRAARDTGASQEPLHGSGRVQGDDDLRKSGLL